MRRALLVAGLIFLVGGAAALVQLVLELRAATAPPTPEAFVNASWVVYRHGQGHLTHVGNLHLACNACHRALETGAFDKPGPAPCASCHQDRSGIEHELVALDVNDVPLAQGQGVRQLANCVACHTFGPEPEQKLRNCMDCHAAPAGAVAAVVTHETAACTACHDVHQNAMLPLPCTQCHALKVEHGPQPALPSAQCRDCHDVHAASSAAIARCETCHAVGGQHPVAATATFGDQHTCTSCHRPHDFAKSKVVACRSCHESIGMLHGHEQSECTSCHQPHAVRESVRDAAPCTSCHATIKPVHGDASHGGGALCTSCHKPHPAASARAAAPCTGCHTNVGGPSHVAHASGLACTSCHEPHAFELASAGRALCQECHAGELRAVATQKAHPDCTTCHGNLPHGPELSAKSCTGCHADVGKTVTSGHAKCAGCHEPHTTDVAGNGCASCHANEAANHPRGHDDCTTCHDVHAGKLLAAASDCSSCHARAKLPSLHQVAKHNEKCQSCHEPHGTSKPAERERCLACHQEQVNHEPSALVCNGCHTFIAPGKKRRSP